MPIREIDIWDKFDGRICFEGPNEVTVMVGPCSGLLLNDAKIPMDGRHYKCGGVIILRNGRHLRASLSLRTHTFDFLEREAVWCKIQDTWYKTEEPEFLQALGLSHDDAFPYTWLPDRPLAYHEKGPYAMNWYDEAKRKTTEKK
jgi:hypothetical protein